MRSSFDRFLAWRRRQLLRQQWVRTVAVVAGECCCITDGTESDRARAHDRELRAPAPLENRQWHGLEVIATAPVASRSELAHPVLAAGLAVDGDLVSATSARQLLTFPAAGTEDVHGGDSGGATFARQRRPNLELRANSDQAHRPHEALLQSGSPSWPDLWQPGEMRTSHRARSRLAPHRPPSPLEAGMPHGAMLVAGDAIRRRRCNPAHRRHDGHGAA